MTTCSSRDAAASVAIVELGYAARRRLSLNSQNSGYMCPYATVPLINVSYTFSVRYLFPLHCFLVPVISRLKKESLLFLKSITEFLNTFIPIKRSCLMLLFFWKTNIVSKNFSVRSIH